MDRRRQEVAGFIRSSFRSIWSLELLLHLKCQPWASPSAEELVTELRASEAIVEVATASLLAAGLVAAEEGHRFRYAPATAAIASLADDTETLYRSQPDLVRRLIVVGSGNLAAFADAFKLRKD